MSQSQGSHSEDVTVLKDLVCRFCAAPIPGLTINGKPPAATNYSKCLRQCHHCEVGASNTTQLGAETWVFKNPLKNVPVEAREGALETLRNALNRTSKLLKFGFFPTSEDAVTWVIFSHLLRTQKLVSTLQSCGLAAVSREKIVPSMLLWGSAASGTEADTALAEQLKSVCLGLDRDPGKLSEPDVVIDLGELGLIFIEVKLRSGNEFKDRTYEGWESYLSADALPWNTDRVRESRCYELARNWRILNALSNGRPATLVNLAPATLFEGKDAAQVKIFKGALNGPLNARFESVSWADFLQVSLADAPEWYSRFCQERKISK